VTEVNILRDVFGPFSISVPGGIEVNLRTKVIFVFSKHKTKSNQFTKKVKPVK
jgi:hypothetical protein